MPPSAIVGVSSLAAGGGGLHHGGELRHADAGDDAGGADAAGADADLDRVRTRLDQRQRTFGRCDVAGDHLHRVRQALDARHLGQNAGGMAVRGVDHQNVHAGLDQRLGASVAVLTHAGGGGDAQAAELVLVCQRVGGRLVHVLDRDQADAAEHLVHHQQLLDPVGVQQAARLVRPWVAGHRDQAVMRVINSRTGMAGIGGEADVAVGQDADQAAVMFDHGNAADAPGGHQRAGFGQASVPGGW